jgi:hypothetical protein
MGALLVALLFSIGRWDTMKIGRSLLFLFVILCFLFFLVENTLVPATILEGKIKVDAQRRAKKAGIENQELITNKINDEVVVISVEDNNRQLLFNYTKSVFGSVYRFCGMQAIDKEGLEKEQYYTVKSPGHIYVLEVIQKEALDIKVTSKKGRWKERGYLGLLFGYLTVFVTYRRYAGKKGDT